MAAGARVAVATHATRMIAFGGVMNATSGNIARGVRSTQLMARRSSRDSHGLF